MSEPSKPFGVVPCESVLQHRIAELEEDHEKLSKRLKSHEDRMAFAMGVVATLSFLAGLGAGKLIGL